MQRIYIGFVIAGLVLLAGAGCQTLREMAALRNVAFALDHVTDARLAGVELQRLKSYKDLSAVEVLRLGRALISKELLLDFQLHLRAENPPDNPVQARLVRMDWTLLIDDQETISGIFDDNIVLPPGQPTDVPIPISLNLVDFFEDGVQDLVELALSVAGQGGASKRIKLQAVPTIDTQLGPIRYPKPIVIISKEVGP